MRRGKRQRGSMGQGIKRHKPSVENKKWEYTVQYGETIANIL